MTQFFLGSSVKCFVFLVMEKAKFSCSLSVSGETFSLVKFSVSHSCSILCFPPFYSSELCHFKSNIMAVVAVSRERSYSFYCDGISLFLVHVVLIADLLIPDFLLISRGMAISGSSLS